VRLTKLADWQAKGADRSLVVVVLSPRNFNYVEFLLCQNFMSQTCKGNTNCEAIWCWLIERRKG